MHIASKMGPRIINRGCIYEYISKSVPISRNLLKVVSMITGTIYTKFAEDHSTNMNSMAITLCSTIF